MKNPNSGGFPRRIPEYSTGPALRGGGAHPTKATPKTRARISLPAMPCLRIEEERAWLENFLRARKADQPRRIAVLMAPLGAREIEAALDRVSVCLFPDGEDRFEAALICALLAKGIVPYDVLNAAPDQAARPGYFMAERVLRLEYSLL